MKIGIYLLDAVVTGTTKFVFELADGFRETGHDVKTLSSTKSGREPVRWTKTDGGARWWFQAPDITVRHEDLTELFDAFDLIIVNDIGSSTLDNEDFKHGKPGYVIALLQTKTPWVPVAHGNSYDAKHAPHFPTLLSDSLRTPRVVLATSAPYDYGQHELFHSLIPVRMARPYRPRFGEFASESRGFGVTAIGRYSTGKNLHALALTLPFAGVATNVINVAGASISSARPTDSYLTYEVLASREETFVMREPESKNRTAAWKLRDHSGTVLEYHGAFTDPLPLLHEQTKAFVNLTSDYFSAGTEYTTMEAIDAGCLLLLPTYMVDSGSALAYGALEPWDIPRSPKNTLNRNAEDLKVLARRVDRTLGTDVATHSKLASYNRRVLINEHHPRVVADRLIRDLNGVLI